jgi:SAM-dependent methyltransferase
VRFLERPFEACDLQGPFDAVIGSSILHHLDIPRALHRMRQLLRPGGWLSFAEPNMMNPQVFALKNVPPIKRWLGDSPDETAFFRWPLRSLLRELAFDEIEITPFDWLHPATPEAWIGAVKRVGLLLERLPIVREFSGSLLIRARRE